MPLLAGLVLGQGFHRRQRLPALAVTGLLCLFVLSLTRWSVPFWTYVPLVHYVQFPWRMLIPIGFLGAVLVAMANRMHRLAWLPLSAVTILVAVSALGQAPSGRFVPPDVLDARTLETHEFGSALDGVAIESEYQPRTASPDVVYASQGRRAAPDDTAAPPLEVQQLAMEPTAFRASVEAAQPSVIRLQSFYFAGWQAKLDGHAWPLRPAPPAGLIEAAIPAGTHTLNVAYSGTRLEGISGLISGVALLGLIGWLLRRRPLVLAPIVLATAAVTGLLAHPPTAQRVIRPSSWSPSPDQTLVGAEGPRLTVQGIEADLVWLFAAPREASFDFVLRDTAGREVRRVSASQAQTMPYEYLAANELLQRHYTFTQPLGIRAGTYSLSLETPASSFPLGQVALDGDVQPSHALNVAFQERAILSGYTIDRVRSSPGLATDDLPSRADALAHPGDFLLVSLLWRAGQTMDQNYTAFVHLIDVDGRSWAAHDNQPDGGLQATSSWVAGQSVPDR
ncbi:MAG TPA: hypothetical protein VKU60_17275, partial [Chloroflexota bacterium]|nr:hypothetical protein [Chloroflexota bacterium]